MILPWLFIIILGISEITFYLLSRNVVHYAAFMAARSALVNQEKTLSEINFPFGDDSFKSKKIAEATAEKIIFESLPWENKRIKVQNSENPLSRSYFDNTDENGAVRLKLATNDGKIEAEVLYCFPIHFNLQTLFLSAKYKTFCSSVTSSDGTSTYSGIPIIEKVALQKNL